MDEFEQKLHHTWVQYLITLGRKDAAAIAIECEISMVINGEYDRNWVNKVKIAVPTSSYSYVTSDDELGFFLRETLVNVMDGQYYSKWDLFLDRDIFNDLTFRILLTEPSEDWKNIIRRLIFAPTDSNQGIVSEKAFARENKSLYLYNEMKFASQAEIRVAQELENRKVLFFPLPLAIRAETGTFYKDHREPDFLVCLDGAWGILEVSHHSNRYEQDSEKAVWFKNSGILCVEHYTSERCNKETGKVVSEFLATLARYKK